MWLLGCRAANDQENTFAGKPATADAAGVLACSSSSPSRFFPRESSVTGEKAAV